MYNSLTPCAAQSQQWYSMAKYWSSVISELTENLWTDSIHFCSKMHVPASIRDMPTYIRYIKLPRIFEGSGWCARRDDILPLTLFVREKPDIFPSVCRTNKVWCHFVKSCNLLLRKAKRAAAASDGVISCPGILFQIVVLARNIWKNKDK
jgi:hypothetical protein